MTTHPHPFLQFFFFFKLATLMQDEANNSMQSFSHIYLCALRVRCFILPYCKPPSNFIRITVHKIIVVYILLYSYQMHFF